MVDCSDSDGKVSATKKKRDQDVAAFLPTRPHRSGKKRVVYFTKSDSETEPDEDNNEALKKRSFKKKANAIDNDMTSSSSAPTQTT